MITREGPWPMLAVVVAAAAAGARLLWIIHRYAVNVFFWDQWDYLDPLFRGDGLWALFNRQHGPIRQGVGNLAIKAFYAMTGWDARSDAIAAAIAMAGAVVVLLAISKRIFGGLSIFDAVIPLAVFNTAAYEIYIGTPNPAHGPVPLFLVAAFTLSLFVARPWPRVLLASFLTFAAVYTGFSVFLGFVAAAVFTVELVRRRQERLAHGAGLVLCLLIGMSFARGYHFEPAVACFQFPDPQPIRYLTFLGWIAVKPFSVIAGSRAGSAVALLGAIALLAVPALSAIRFLRGEDPLARTVFVLSGFSLLFALGTALGRVCLGPQAAEASRYVPYMTPAIVGAYFLLRSMPPTRPRDALLALFLLACIVKELRPEQGRRGTMEWFRRGKSAWASCYREIADVARCDARANFRVHPFPEGTHLEQKLAWLRERKLGLFNGAASTAP